VASEFSLQLSSGHHPGAQRGIQHREAVQPRQCPREVDSSSLRGGGRDAGVAAHVLGAEGRRMHDEPWTLTPPIGANDLGVAGAAHVEPVQLGCGVQARHHRLLHAETGRGGSQLCGRRSACHPVHPVAHLSPSSVGQLCADLAGGVVPQGPAGG